MRTVGFILHTQDILFYILSAPALFHARSPSSRRPLASSSFQPSKPDPDPRASAEKSVTRLDGVETGQTEGQEPYMAQQERRKEDSEVVTSWRKEDSETATSALEDKARGKSQGCMGQEEGW